MLAKKESDRMGTRHLTQMYDYDGAYLLTMYGQYDGYPEGYGQELADFLSEITLVNGIGGQKFKIANGPGCLAAQIVSHFKGNGVGSFYIYPPDSRLQEFTYKVICVGSHDSEEKHIEMEVTSTHVPEFSWRGLPKDFDGKKIHSQMWGNEEKEGEEEQEQEEVSDLEQAVKDADMDTLLRLQTVISEKLASEK